MIFTLEALQAKHGDALLLHYGDSAAPELIVIDGGPSGVFNRTLKPRLDELRTLRNPDERLPIPLLMVSHIDDDHINGVLQLTRRLAELHEDGKDLPYEIQSFWHNSFDDIVGGQAERLSATLSAAVAPVATGGDVPPGLPLSRHGALVAASVKQGRELRENARRLSLNINQGFSGLVMAPAGGKTVSLGHGLSFTVLGPREQRVEELHAEWDKEIQRLNLAQPEDAKVLAAEFIDKSVFNLSSIIVLATAGDRRMLLTGDARGDDILAGLEAANLLTDGTIHFDLLKMPHHGSEHNVNAEFFQRVTADHYVISADGKHGNPDMPTLQMLSAARGNDEYRIHLTNREPRLTEFFEAEKAAGRR